MIILKKKEKINAYTYQTIHRIEGKFAIQMMITKIPIPCFSPFQMKKYWCYVVKQKFQIEQNIYIGDQFDFFPSKL